ncbi:MAG: hypothetical protein ACR2IK_07975 [Chloroflexota bacterium]
MFLRLFAEENVALFVALADDQRFVRPAVLHVLTTQAGHLGATHTRVEQHMQQRAIAQQFETRDAHAGPLVWQRQAIEVDEHQRQPWVDPRGADLVLTQDHL